MKPVGLLVEAQARPTGRPPKWQAQHVWVLVFEALDRQKRLCRVGLHDLDTEHPLECLRVFRAVLAVQLPLWMDPLVQSDRDLGVVCRP